MKEAYLIDGDFSQSRPHLFYHKSSKSSTDNAFGGLKPVSERRWDESFSRSPNILAKLAASAMAEYRAGQTQELDPETL